MSLHLGSNEINKVYLGSTEIQDIYKGSDIVYSSNFGIVRFLDANGNLNQPTEDQATSIYNGVEVLNEDALSYAFYNRYTMNKSVLFNSLKTINTNGLSYAFYGCYGIKDTVSFPSLITIGNEGMRSAYQGCSNIKGEISLPSLQTVNDNGLYSCFRNCSNVTSVDLSSLQTVRNSGLKYAFFNCQNLEGDIEFKNLQTVDYQGLAGVFYNCSKITSVYFNSLVNVDNTALSSAFDGCENLTEIHFLSTMEETISGLSGFDENFGAENATILFDINAVDLTFTVTPIENTKIYLDGKLLKQTRLFTSSDDKVYTIINPNYPIVSNTLTDLVVNTQHTETVNLANVDTKVLTINTNIANCKGIFKIDNLEVKPSTTSSSFTLNVSNGTTVYYYIDKEGYMFEEDTLTVTENKTISLTMKEELLDSFDWSKPNFNKVGSSLIDTDKYFNLFDNNNYLEFTIPERYVGEDKIKNLEIQLHLQLNSAKTSYVYPSQGRILQTLKDGSEDSNLYVQCGSQKICLGNSEATSNDANNLYTSLFNNNYDNLNNRNSKEFYLKFLITNKEANTFVSLDNINYYPVSHTEDIKFFFETNTIRLGGKEDRNYWFCGKVFKEGTFIKADNHFIWKPYEQTNNLKDVLFNITNGNNSAIQLTIDDVEFNPVLSTNGSYSVKALVGSTISYKINRVGYLEATGSHIVTADSNNISVSLSADTDLDISLNAQADDVYCLLTSNLVDNDNAVWTPSENSLLKIGGDSFTYSNGSKGFFEIDTPNYDIDLTLNLATYIRFEDNYSGVYVSENLYSNVTPDKVNRGDKLMLSDGTLEGDWLFRDKHNTTATDYSCVLEANKHYYIQFITSNDSNSDNIVVKYIKLNKHSS